MIHGQYPVEMCVEAVSEESVGGIWAECVYLLFAGLPYGRDDDIFLLVAEQSVFTGVRVECQDGDAWFYD